MKISGSFDMRSAEAFRQLFLELLPDSTIQFFPFLQSGSFEFKAIAHRAIPGLWIPFPAL
ncbi:hypothetical protein A7E75_12300 [Syntrophotalea acetylenica]|uniref:Uncharacterized protein n=1 Tax=Syntrophotalea acetylenica TaxID=29542 RepID=A0A1L3GIJ4_SYNAC|nr:hypothetical protein A7E75_12300 [Syntrophotalea acetylenica]